MQALKDNCFIPFRQSTDTISLPEQFTFPFYYDPHPLSLLAAKELQEHLQTQTEWEHNFGLNPEQSGLVIGKMFGVMVVQNDQGELGYLAAFSGKLAGGNHHSRFVPPVFDMLKEDGFFKREEAVISKINKDIELLENAEDLLACKRALELEKETATFQLERQRQRTRAAKQARKKKRQEFVDQLSPEEYSKLEDELRVESLHYSAYLKDLTQYWNLSVSRAEQKLMKMTKAIDRLKEERKERSSRLQQQIFEQYRFLNAKNEWKNLADVFAPIAPLQPPAGSGECAAPKLLQYAYLNNLRPISMAEFWWGASPKSEIRKHGQFYPSCRGKCEPILGHMLQGLNVEANPMLANPAEGKQLEIIHEDEYLAIVHKPAEFLSVPGKSIEDSVYLRMKERYPNATGPLIVHRLDMATSGLMLIARNKEIHKKLQRQFINRTVKKRYVALLDGTVNSDSGVIDLPLRIDLNDRPRQLVCHEHGKKAVTQWEVVKRSNGRTRIHFYPITGRTHQLRMHAAHPDGLNAPIIGDDLYGTRDRRLHLHAEYIEFQHPISRERISFSVEPDF